MSPSPPSPATISVETTLDAPSFVPGSLVTATITLRADPPAPTLSHSTSHPSRTAPRATHSAFYSTSLSTLSTESTPAIVDYVVTELSGRWSSDRAWVLPHAHPDASSHTLDYHLRQPVTEHTAHTQDTSALPWAGALADANKVGGGGRPGHTGIVFRSPALVVCEREQIPVGSQVCFEVSCVLPDRVPPSLRGIAMRYSYALVVVVGFAGCLTPRVVRVPLRVVSAGGTGRDAERAGEVIEVPTPRGVGPVSNRFLEEREVRALTMRARLVKGAAPDDIEIALALSLNGRLTAYKADEERRRGGDDEMGGLGMIRELKVVTVGAEGREEGKKRQAIPVYGISYLGASVARMYLSKRGHYLGDTVSAIFHFTGERECYRLGARLEMQEVIRRECAVAPTAGGGGEDDEEDGDAVVFRRVYGEHGEFVMANRNTHVTFSIPHDAAPSFTTGVVTVKWRMHFEFLIPKKRGDRGGDQAHMVRGGGDVDEIDALLDDMRVEENGAGAGAGEVGGWEGGVWEGEEPVNWTHVPQKDVDVLRWTLPLVVSGQAGSHWGSRSSGKLVHTMK